MGTEEGGRERSERPTKEHGRELRREGAERATDEERPLMLANGRYGCASCSRERGDPLG